MRIRKYGFRNLRYEQENDQVRVVLIIPDADQRNIVINLRVEDTPIFTTTTVVGSHEVDCVFNRLVAWDAQSAVGALIGLEEELTRHLGLLNQRWAYEYHPLGQIARRLRLLFDVAGGLFDKITGKI